MDASSLGEISPMFFRPLIRDNICTGLRSGAKVDPFRFSSAKFQSNTINFPSWAGVRCRDENCEELQVNYCCEGEEKPAHLEARVLILFTLTLIRVVGIGKFPTRLKVIT